MAEGLHNVNLCEAIALCRFLGQLNEWCGTRSAIGARPASAPDVLEFSSGQIECAGGGPRAVIKAQPWRGGQLRTDRSQGALCGILLVAGEWSPVRRV